MNDCLDNALSRETLLDWSELQIRPYECDTTQTNAFADKAISDSVSQFWDDISIKLNEFQQEAHRPFRGTIGEKSRDSVSNLSGDYVGVRFELTNQIDQRLYINKVGLIINQSRSVDVSIYKAPHDSVGYEFVNQFTITATANTLSYSGPLDYVYDLEEDGCRMTYYMVYEPSTSAPWNTRLYCNCGGRKRQERNQQEKYFYVKGIQGNDLTKLKDWSCDSNASFGMVVDTEVKCDQDNLICLNYEENRFKVGTDEAIKYKAAELYVLQIIDSPDLNRLTLLNREQLFSKMHDFSARYGEMVDWLAMEINTDLNDCYTFRPSMRTMYQA